MAAARRAGQQQSLLPAVIAVGAAAFAGGIWYGLPGPAAAVVALLVWAWTEPAPPLTGPKKPGTSSPSAGNPAEEKLLARYQTAQQARFAPVTSAWIPGWPLQASFLLGLAMAGVAAALPVREPWMIAVSAAGMFTGVAGFAAARRRVTGNPGSTAKTLFELAGVRRTLIKLLAFAVGGALVGGVAGQALNVALQLSPAGPAPIPWLLTVAATVAGAGAGVGVPWRAEALKDWRDLCKVRDEWRPRWQLVKFDPEPAAVETKMVGPFRFTTFDCQGAKGSQDLFNLTGKLDAVLPSGTGYAVCPSPMEFKTGPQVGTIHPSKAQIVTWDQTEWPDLTVPDCDVQIVEAACQIALSAGSVGRALAPVIATEVVPLHTEESSSALWMASLTMSSGDAGSARAGGIGSAGVTAGMLGWTTLDHRQQVVRLYFGDPEADVEPQVTKALDVVAEEDMWTSAWLASLKTNVNPPSLQPAQSRTATLAGGAVVERAAFAVRLGVDVSTMMTAQVERNLATAFLGTTFITISGWTEGVAGRPGERHKGAFTVYKSKESRLPANPDQMAPRPGSQAPTWMMSGFFNHAFDALRLPRPEVVSAKALTKPDSRSHLWEVRLRLYGGVTFGDVRTQAERLRQALGSGWLRVQDADDGCVVFCGAPWRKVQLANPRRDVERVTRLDWTQAMTDAKVFGAGNRVPELTGTSTLPCNEQVQVLEFDLPPGVDREMLVKALPKLRTGSGSEYLELRRSDKGASAITILAAEHDPMPARVDFDPSAAAGSSAGFAFATGVEGTPICFDPEDASHIAILGSTGSGKALPDSCRVPVPVQDRFPDGWALHGDLQPGDLVWAADGTPTQVIHVHEPVTDHPMLKLTFDDGRSIVAGANHLWKVTDVDSRAAHGQYAAGRRAEWRQRHTAKAQMLRQMAAENPRGAVATVLALSRLTGASPKVIERLSIHDMAHWAPVQTTKKSRLVNAWQIADLMEKRPTIAGAAIPFGGIGDLRTAARDVDGRITARDCASILLRRPATRREGHRIGTLATNHDVDVFDGGRAYTTERVFPVSEVLLLLADWYDQHALGSRNGTPTRSLYRIMATKQMWREAFLGGNQPRSMFAVDLPEPVEGVEQHLPVEPYVFGAWLGDGTSRTGAITTCDPEVVAEVEAAGFAVRRIESGRSGRAKVWHFEGLRAALARTLPKVDGARDKLDKRIPDVYLTASTRQRMALLQGLMDTDGTISKSGSCELTLAKQDLAEDALALIRSLGIKASMSINPAAVTLTDPETGTKTRKSCGVRYRIKFTTDQPVFRLPRKAERIPATVRDTQRRIYITRIEPVATVPARCINVASPDGLYLAGDWIPTHNSVAAQIIVSAAVAAGFEVHIADPTKGAADLLFLDAWARSFSTTMEDTEATLEYVYGEVRRRVEINKRFGCDFRTVPAEYAYGRIMVVLDEFESLYKSFEAVGKPSDDPNVEETRLRAARHNEALTRVLDIVGRIAREARSAGVVMVVLGQKMVASEMEKVGLKTLKNNLGRLLMGKTTWGDRSSALRNAQDAADLGDVVPRGRGLYESMIANAVAVQVWYASQDQLAAMLAGQVPAVEKLDLSKYRRAVADTGPTIQAVSIDSVAPLLEVVELGEMDVDLDELDALAELMDAEEAVSEPEPPPGPEAVAGADPELGQLEGPEPAAELDPDAELAELWGADLDQPQVDAEAELASLWADSDTAGSLVEPDTGDGPATSGDLFADLSGMWTDEPAPLGQSVGGELDPFAHIDWSADAPEAAAVQTGNEPDNDRTVDDAETDDRFGSDMYVEPAPTIAGPAGPADPWRGLSGWDDE